MKGLNIFIVCILICAVLCDSATFDNKIKISNGKCSEVKNIPSSTIDHKIILKTILPSSIRYMEVTKVEVMIYNNINSKNPLDVEINLTNDSKHSKFRFFNNNLDPKIATELTEVITVPNDQPKLFSFYIHTEDKINLNDILNIKIIASVISENYQCFLTKRVKVDPPLARIYHEDTNSYTLNSTQEPILTLLKAKDPPPHAISKMIINIHDYDLKPDIANLTITLKDEHGYKKVISIIKFHIFVTVKINNEATNNTYHELEMILPKNTKNVTALIEGFGYCLITVVTEHAHIIDKPNPQFNLEITPMIRRRKSCVEVCALYEPLEDENNNSTIRNVIYDVEMPNGYFSSGSFKGKNAPNYKVRKLD